MRTLILAAGRFGDAARQAIADGREPRLDVFELAAKLDADVIDFLDVERSSHPLVRGVSKALGLSAAVAQLGYLRRHDYDAMLTTGEDIGLPLAVLLKTSRARVSHDPGSSSTSWDRWVRRPCFEQRRAVNTPV